MITAKAEAASMLLVLMVSELHRQSRNENAGVSAARREGRPRIRIGTPVVCNLVVLVFLRSSECAHEILELSLDLLRESPM